MGSPTDLVLWDFIMYRKVAICINFLRTVSCFKKFLFQTRKILHNLDKFNKI